MVFCALQIRLALQGCSRTETVMARDKLSKRQESIYAFICAYTNERGYPPSVREIGTAVGLASPSTVAFHISRNATVRLLTAGPTSFTPVSFQ